MYGADEMVPVTSPFGHLKMLFFLLPPAKHSWPA